MEVVGILLAAGRGTRFDATAQRLKLLAPRSAGASAGMALAAAAARNLRGALDTVLAVVRDEPGSQQEHLQALLQEHGCTVLRWSPATGAAEGIGASIALAVQASPAAMGWIVALADMPDIRADTVRAVRDAIRAGAASAAPFYQGRRGHPVGFGAVCGAELAALAGEAGARAVLGRHRPQHIDVDDPGVLLDIDRPEDL